MKKLLLVALISFAGSSLVASEDFDEKKKSSKTKYIIPALTILTGTGLMYVGKKLLTWSGFGLFTEASKDTPVESAGNMLDVFFGAPIIIGGTLLGVTGLGISAVGGYNMYSAAKKDNE